MCRVNVTDLRANLSQYLAMSLQEDIQVTKNDEVIAVISNPNKAYYQTLMDLYGCMSEGDTGEDYDTMIGEEIMKRCGF